MLSLKTVPIFLQTARNLQKRDAIRRNNLNLGSETWIFSYRFVLNMLDYGVKIIPDILYSDLTSWAWRYITMM